MSERLNVYKRRIKKAQQGIKFVSYNVVEDPVIDYTDITNPINPFSEYYIPTTYNTEQALVVPEREDSKSDTVEETPVVASKPIAELVVNKPVASKVVVDNTANSTWSSPYKDRSKWIADLTNAYKRAGITNDNAIRMLVSQDALESAWGRSAQGKFNFGNLTTGAKWKGDYVTGNDKNAKGEAIKQKFRSYNSMDEYAADKVQFLKRLYDFDENDDINKFVAKLTGSNKGKRRYAEARNYADTLKKVYNSYRSGGIIKYQNPAQPIKYMGGYDKRGNMVLPVTNENGMNNVTLPEVTVTPRNINLAGAVDKGRREAAPYISTLLAGTMFGPLPVLSEAIGSTTVDEATRELSKGKYNTWGDMMTNAGMNPVLAEFTNPGSYIGLHGFNKFGPRLKPVEDLAASGNKWARARVISKTINKGTPSVEPLPNNVGWGPRQSIHVVHDKNSARFPKLYYPERWDAVYEGAPEAGIWYQGKFGNPRTAANHSIPGKAEKAAKARERFAKRPYRVEGDLELERPIVTVGDVPNRAALERAADKMNADGVVFNNVYDNGYSNNQVIFSLRDDLKNGRLFKKEPNTLASNKYPAKNLEVNLNPDTPTTTIKRSGTSPYREIGKAIEPKSKSRLKHITVESPIFGDYIDNGSQQVVFNSATDPNKVLKVFVDRKFTSIPEIKEFHKQWMKRNKLPLQERIDFEGYLQGDGRIYPVYSQNRVSILGNILPSEWVKVHLPKLNKEMRKFGYSNNGGVFTNGKLTVGDISSNNVGYIDGNIRFVDADVYKKGGKLLLSR
jgi:flagellum-specific peptidoglycan hydrolase FlgJ